MLEAKSLTKAVVPSTLIPNPSPANLHSSRLALHVSDDGSSCWVYIASGRHIYKLQIPFEDSLVSKGKESLLIPIHAEVMDSFLVNRCPHRSEIQGIVLQESESTGYLMLGSVDSYGDLIVSKLDTNGKDVDRLTYTVSPRDHGVGESSWAGLCFSPTQWSMAAVALNFSKTVDIYDQDIHVQTLRTVNLTHIYRLLYPSALSFMQNLHSGNESSILAVAEGCQLTIWDLRMKENGGCLQRICGSVGDIYYAVCSSSTGNIAVGGADRTVTIYDPRRWSALSRWVNCSKYEITGLSFSSIDPDYIYIQGVDYEVLCGHWKARNKLFAFRGDSNWLGFSKCHNRDVLGGWCDSGSIFVADVVAKESEIKEDFDNESTISSVNSSP
ncbi:Guanine nucleotide-binding protein, beta subunit [Parasponia andersonii]|uniref:Guanine nucleotide-binding protein, beta subunit n=1 Tax=Parasponia andersonii TaxID=3476 RepID=A0A2P5DSE3_PARAD|nr:Guanine nucleotide-binding protein, beta subunit [Parasponia andersonii]